MSPSCNCDTVGLRENGALCQERAADRFRRLARQLPGRRIQTTAEILGKMCPPMQRPTPPEVEPRQRDDIKRSPVRAGKNVMSDNPQTGGNVRDG